MKIIAEIGNRQELDKILKRGKDSLEKALTFQGKLSERGIRLTMDELDFSQAVYSAWNYEAQMVTPVAISAPCGFGKSTMLQTWVVHNSKTKGSTFGAIVAVPKRGQVEEFCKEVNKEAGKVIALALLGKNDEMSEVQYKEQFQQQERVPILVMTHKMLELLTSQGKLQEFVKWYDEKGNSRRRTQLFIDEKPQFIDVQSLTPVQIEKTVDLVRAVSMDLYGFEKPYCKLIRDKAEELQIELTKPIEEGSSSMFPTNAVDLFFEVPKELFYDWLKYSEKLGTDYSLLGIFQEAIRRGGTVQVSGFGRGTGTSFLVGSVIWKEITFMNTFVLDASAIGDKQYEIAVFNKIAPVIPEDAYSQFIMRVSKQHNLGRDFFKRNKDAIQKTVKLVNELASKHENIAIVVYKDLIEEYKEALSSLVSAGRVKLKYFDNERATNDYRDCDAILFLGMNRKNFAYYVEATKTITEDQISYESSTSGGFRFKDETLNEACFSDMYVDRKQGMERIRGYKSKTPKYVYMFSTYEELPEMLLEGTIGARLEEWELPFKLTDGEEKKDSKERFKDWLKGFALGEADSVKAKEVYSETLGIDVATFSRLKKDVEILALMDSLGIKFQGQKIIKNG